MPAAAAARTFPEPLRSLPLGTKLDLLPRGTEPERVADWLSGAARKIGGVVDVHLVSSKSGDGLQARAQRRADGDAPADRDTPAGRRHTACRHDPHASDPALLGLRGLTPPSGRRRPAHSSPSGAAGTSSFSARDRAEIAAEIEPRSQPRQRTERTSAARRRQRRQVGLPPEHPWP